MESVAAKMQLAPPMQMLQPRPISQADFSSAQARPAEATRSNRAPSIRARKVSARCDRRGDHPTPSPKASLRRFRRARRATSSPRSDHHHLPEFLRKDHARHWPTAR